jgi:hypothetical protein
MMGDSCKHGTLHMVKDQANASPLCSRRLHIDYLLSAAPKGEGWRSIVPHLRIVSELSKYSSPPHSQANPVPPSVPPQVHRRRSTAQHEHVENRIREPVLDYDLMVSKRTRGQELLRAAACRNRC